MYSSFVSIWNGKKDLIIRNSRSKYLYYKVSSFYMLTFEKVIFCCISSASSISEFLVASVSLGQRIGPSDSSACAPSRTAAFLISSTTLFASSTAVAPNGFGNWTGSSVSRSRDLPATSLRCDLDEPANEIFRAASEIEDWGVEEAFVVGFGVAFAVEDRDVIRFDATFLGFFLMPFPLFFCSYAA